MHRQTPQSLQTPAHTHMTCTFSYISLCALDHISLHAPLHSFTSLYPFLYNLLPIWTCNPSHPDTHPPLGPMQLALDSHLKPPPAPAHRPPTYTCTCSLPRILPPPSASPDLAPRSALTPGPPRFLHIWVHICTHHPNLQLHPHPPSEPTHTQMHTQAPQAHLNCHVDGNLQPQLLPPPRPTLPSSPESTPSATSSSAPSLLPASTSTLHHTPT